MSEAIKFNDAMCPVEDQPFLFDFSEELNEINDDIASITSITIDAAATTAGFEQHSDVITDVNNDGKLTENGGVTVSFRVNALKQSDIYWDNPGNEVCITVLIATTGAIKLALTGLLTVSQPC
jgi:hypothetical protein